jgi:hypothetical protein
MLWMPEVMKAEVLRRHERARHNALIRQLRESRRSSSYWWRRLRSHPEPVEDQGDRAPRAA